MFKERFINYLRFEKRYSVHTTMAYEKEIDEFSKFLDAENIPFNLVDYKNLRFYFSTMRESGKQASSVNRSISSLKSFYKFLHREGLILNNPITLIKSLKTSKKLPVIVEKDKLSTLLDQLNENISEFEDLRNYVVLELLFGTGIRLSELIKIKEHDIDFYNKKILILGKRSKERFVPIHQTLIKELQKYLLLKKAQNFKNNSLNLIVTKEGEPAYSKLIYRIVNKYLSLVTTQKKKSPHVLRHTFATALLDKGADLNAIKELLGHAGLSATQIYTHNSAERLKTIYKQAHPKA